MERGKVVQLGQHRLICGDAFNPEHVDLLMQGEKADMLYCDPPYGDRATHRNYFSKYPNRGKGVYRGALLPVNVPIVGDDVPFDPRSIIERFDYCSEQFWWGADYYVDRIPNATAGSWVSWDKRITASMDRVIGSQFELCWSRKRHRREIARIQWCGIYGWQNDVFKKRCHPTQKPTALAEWLLERYSKPDAIVVDLFAGSGSTLLACERMGRRARVMEIDPHYCQVIIDRYQALTRQPKLPLTA